MTTIGVIGAMQNEIDILIKNYNLKKDKKNKDIYVNEFNDKRIVVAMSGVGKTNSAAMTQYIIDKYNVDAVINSGVAGALNNNLKVMDIVISNYATYHDFYPVKIMESYVPNNGKILANNILIELAKSVINAMNINNAHIAPICSGDAFIQDEKIKNNILLRTGASIVDMESASIAHTCQLNNVPFLSVRTVSDMADGGEYQEDLAAYKSSEFVTRLVNEIFLYLKKYAKDNSKIFLYVPTFDELDYYEYLLRDERTMEYNAGYDLNLDGYDKDTGCIIKFDNVKWYKRQMNDKNRYFAYIIDKEENMQVGYVNFRFDEVKLEHSCGITIEYKFRNKGYGTEALKELLNVAFNEYNFNSLICTVPYNRTDALKILTKNGFKDLKQDTHLKKFNNNERLITMCITKDEYNNV